MIKKTTNVTVVGSHILNQETWRDTLIQSIIVKKVKNVSHVENHFLGHKAWRSTLIQFTMVKKITNVAHVESHFLNWGAWRHILIQFTCGKLFSEAGSLKRHINSIHNGQKYPNRKQTWSILGNREPKVVFSFSFFEITLEKSQVAHCETCSSCMNTFNKICLI